MVCHFVSDFHKVMTTHCLPYLQYMLLCWFFIHMLQPDLIAFWQVLLADFELGVRDESLLWSQSEDMGEGYHCIRMVNKITSNLDALQGDKKSGGVKDGTPVILFAWKKQENQVWKIIPAW